MAIIDRPTHSGLTGDGLSYQRVEGRTKRAALALLLSGEADADNPSVDQFLSFGKDHEMDLTECWAALLNGHPQASALLVPSAGRAGLFFMSNVKSSRAVDTMATLLNAACEAQSPQKLTLLQVLLDTGQEHEVAALRGAGFSSLATLGYMQRHADSNGKATLKLDHQDITVTNWSEANRSHFEDAVLASYEQTLDCPALLGLRKIEDVIAGHMSTGEFHPKLWFALRHGEEPVGAMLLNVIPQRNALELVYLGLCPKWRGLGLARQLVYHALALAPKYNTNQVILAVDEKNEPALKLYRKLGFVSTAKKHAMIRSLV